MTRLYHFDEGSLSLMPGFADKTINVFEWSLAGSVIVVAVHREARQPEESFAELVQRTVDETTERLGGHQEDDVAAAPRLEVMTSRRAYRHWNAHEQLYHQQVFIDLGAKALVISGTSPARLRPANDRLVETAVAGLHLRDLPPGAQETIRDRVSLPHR